MGKGVHDGRKTAQDVLKWLQNVRKCDELIDAKIAEREQIWALATKITPVLSDMPKGSGVSDTIANAVVKLNTLAEEINALVDYYVDYKAEVVATLEKLPSKEFGVLHRHYVQYMTWEDIARDMNYSPYHIWRIKNNAIELLIDVIE